MEEFWHSGGLQIYQLGLACMITNNEWSMGETGPAAVADLQGFEEVVDAKRKSKILWRRLDDLQSLWPRNLFNLMFIQVKGRGRREAINTCCWIFRELGIMQIKWLFLQFLFWFFLDPLFPTSLKNDSQPSTQVLKRDDHPQDPWTWTWVAEGVCCFTCSLLTHPTYLCPLRNGVSVYLTAVSIFLFLNCFLHGKELLFKKFPSLLIHYIIWKYIVFQNV